MKFTEFNGMILLESEDAAQEGMRRVKENGGDFSRWKYEQFANHRHADMSLPDREHVREEMEIAANFEMALRGAYPDRAFVITHIPCYVVSFYQLIDDAPTEYVPPPEPIGEAARCQNCQRRRDYDYTLLPEPDAEFPWLNWAACNVCGNDLLLTRRAEFRRVIRASAVNSE